MFKAVKPKFVPREKYQAKEPEKDPYSKYFSVDKDAEIVNLTYTPSEHKND
jgi:hypothetical protein